MARARKVFVGFLLPTKIANRLFEESEKLKATGARGTWTPVERMHVTLRYLGEVDDAGVLQAAGMLKDAVKGVGALRLSALGLRGFPEGGPARVVVAGMRGESEADSLRLTALRAALDVGARERGFRPDRGAFTPHVTLGRLREPDESGVIAAKMGPAVRREFGRFRIEEIALLESTEVFEERTYMPLATARLSR